MSRSKIKTKGKQNLKNNCVNPEGSNNKNQVENEKRITTGVEDNNTIDKNKYIFELVNMWIGNADNKVNIAFAMLSAFVATVVFVTENLLSSMIVNQNANKCYLVFFYIGAIFSAICFCFSVFCYIKAITPRLTRDKSFKKKDKRCKERKELKYSIFYDIIKYFDNVNDYVECAKNADDLMFNEELLKEIYYNSGICSKKMYWLKNGAWSLFCTIVSTMGAALFYFLYAVGF